jgi:hypothetical protein
VAIVDSEATETALVRDYLGRLHAAGWGLDPARRDELVGEVREHIDEALRGQREAGHQGEAVVRNVLERLGPPEEIVRAESEGQPYGVAGAPPSGHAAFAVPVNQAGQATAYGEANWWGPAEIIAMLLLSVGGFVLPGVGPIIGVVLVWVSTRWMRPQKVVGSLLGLLPATLPLLLFARFRPSEGPLMFNAGPSPTELLLIGLIPLSGVLAAVYLSLALRGNSRRHQERP